MAVVPERALLDGFSGGAVMSCKVSTSGALFDCSVDSETPPGMGFGAAVLALAPKLRVKPATRDGVPVEGAMRVPVSFNVPRDHRRMHINVPWIAAPTYDQMAAAYPVKARQHQIGGRVVLSCQFKTGGRLGRCRPLREEPEGTGFGEAATSLAEAFLAPAELANGTKIAGMDTHIAFTFDAEMLDAAKQVVEKPRWVSVPEGDQVLNSYPPAAVRAGVRSARVVMDCVAAEGGRLESCALQTEEPAGLGFSQSALGLVSAFRLRLWTDDGVPIVGGRVRIPLRYELPIEPPAPGGDVAGLAAPAPKGDAP